MVWHDRGPDPMTDPAASAVLAAFEAARRDDLPQVHCYRAGVLAWRRAHPDSAAQIRRAEGGRCDPRGEGQAARRGYVIAARRGVEPFSSTSHNRVPGRDLGSANARRAAQFPTEGSPGGKHVQGPSYCGYRVPFNRLRGPRRCAAACRTLSATDNTLRSADRARGGQEGDGGR
jgi:hypothetical protein